MPAVSRTQRWGASELMTFNSPSVHMLPTDIVNMIKLYKFILDYPEHPVRGITQYGDSWVPSLGVGTLERGGGRPPQLCRIARLFALSDRPLLGECFRRGQVGNLEAARRHGEQHAHGVVRVQRGARINVHLNSDVGNVLRRDEVIEQSPCAASRPGGVIDGGHHHLGVQPAGPPARRQDIGRDVSVSRADPRETVYSDVQKVDSGSAALIVESLGFIVLAPMGKVDSGSAVFARRYSSNSSISSPDLRRGLSRGLSRHDWTMFSVAL